jgi:hypothetical protein
MEVEMRAFNQQLGSPSMALVTESEDLATAFKQWMSRMRRASRSLMCAAINGGHELYRARTDTKLYQQCLLCGHETNGWTIDRRDRRLHLVTNHQATAARR